MLSSKRIKSGNRLTKDGDDPNEMPGRRRVPWETALQSLSAVEHRWFISTEAAACAECTPAAMSREM